MRVQVRSLNPKLDESLAVVVANSVYTATVEVDEFKRLRHLWIRDELDEAHLIKSVDYDKFEILEPKDYAG